MGGPRNITHILCNEVGKGSMVLVGADDLEHINITTADDCRRTNVSLHCRRRSGAGPCQLAGNGGYHTDIVACRGRCCCAHCRRRGVGANELLVLIIRRGWGLLVARIIWVLIIPIIFDKVVVVMGKARGHGVDQLREFIECGLDIWHMFARAVQIILLTVMLMVGRHTHCFYLVSNIAKSRKYTSL